MKRKVKKYVIMFCVLLFSLAVYAHLHDPHGVAYDLRILNYFGLEEMMPKSLRTRTFPAILNW